MAEILNIQGLETHFDTQDGTIHAVNGISLCLQEGETLGIVGESGCGKSVSMMSLLGLIPNPPGKVVAGTAIFKDKDLLKMSSSELRKIRGFDISMVFQDPMTYFNPVLNIWRQVSEPLEIHKGVPHKQTIDRVVEVMESVGIANAIDRINDYPHQYSGGMRQRVMIAMALICSPKILIADEPTTALDVTIQAQIVDLIKKLRDQYGMAIIWITHDLGLLAGLADRVSVMYAGYIIEEAGVNELYQNPRHPYTIGLLESLPRLDDIGKRSLKSIDGMPPILFEKPNYCPFFQRCRYRVEKCSYENPSLLEYDQNHKVACWVNVEDGRIYK